MKTPLKCAQLNLRIPYVVFLMETYQKAKVTRFRKYSGTSVAVEGHLSTIDSQLAEQGMSRLQSHYQRHSGSGYVCQKYQENVNNTVRPKM